MINELIELGGDEVPVASEQKASLDKESQTSEFLKNKFNKDTRYKEVEYLLDPSVDMVLKQ